MNITDFSLNTPNPSLSTGLGQYCLDVTAENIPAIQSLILSSMFDSIFKTFYVFITLSFVLLNVYAYFKLKKNKKAENYLFTLYLLNMLMVQVFSIYLVLFKKLNIPILIIFIIIIGMFFRNLILSMENSFGWISKKIINYFKGK